MGYDSGMTKLGETKETKRSGNGLMKAGAVVAVIAVLLFVASFIGGGSGGPLQWVLLVAGVGLAVAGYAVRMLHAAERR